MFMQLVLWSKFSFLPKVNIRKYFCNFLILECYLQVSFVGFLDGKNLKTYGRTMVPP